MKQFYLLVLFFLSLKLMSQSPEPDSAFNVRDNGTYQQNIGLGGVVLPNNKILTTYKKSIVEYNVLLLNADGSPDRTFNTTDSYSTTETRIFAKSDGGFLTLTYDGKLKAFHADGTLNSDFTITTIKNTNPDTYKVNDIIYQDDGKAILYGAFDTFNDVYAVGFVRLNSDGSVDPTFKWKSAGKKIAMQNDGKYVAVSGSKPSRYLADGKIDPTFNVIATIDPLQKFVTNGFQTADNSSINDIAVQPDGKVIVVGCNYVENGKTVAYNIVRLNVDGTRDKAFKSLDSQSENVSKVYLQKDNKIILNVNSYKFIRLNTDGSIDATFKYENKVSFLNKGRFYFQGDKMIISGDFKDNQGITRSEIHRINADGSLDMTFNPHSGPNLSFDEWDNSYHQYDFVSKVLLDQKVLLVGDFSTYNDIPVRNICRIDQNGAYDSTFKLDPTVKIYAESSQNSYTIVPQTDGKILLLHNNAISANGISKSLIRLNSDGSLDSGFNFQDYSSRITAIRLLQNGKILLMGNSGVFVKNGAYYGTYVNTILRLNSDGSVDASYNGAFNQKPVSITELSNKKILISFYRENNVYGYDAAVRFNEDGSKDTSFKSGFIPYYDVKELQDGKLLAIIDQKITRINIDGSTDTSFTPYSIAKTFSNKYDRFDYYQNGQINLFFTTYLTGTTSKLTLSSEGTLLNTIVYKSTNSFEIQNCEDLIFYGYFDEIDGVTKSNLVRFKTSDSSANPVGEIYQSFTNGQTLADLKVVGTDIKWYTLQSNCGINNKITKKGTADPETFLPSTTLLVSGTTYYASQSLNSIESSYRLPVTVYSATLGVKEIDIPNLVTYPNPVKDYYTISNTEEISKVEVYDISGQLQFRNLYNNNNLKIDFTSLSSGLYFVKIFSAGKTVTIKTIKN